MHTLALALVGVPPDQSYVQPRTERYLAAEAVQALFVSTSGAWLVGRNGQIRCCERSADLSACSVLHRSPANGARVAVAPGANGTFGAVIVHPKGLLSTMCRRPCDCNPFFPAAVSVAPGANVSDVSLAAPNGPAYVASSSGLLVWENATSSLQPLAMLPRVPFTAVAVSRRPSTTSSTHRVDPSVAEVAAATADTLYLRGRGSGGGWRHEFLVGLFDGAQSALAFGNRTLWSGGTFALHSVDYRTGLIARHRGSSGLPAAPITALVVGERHVWLGTASGAARLDTAAGSDGQQWSWRWFSGARWLGTRNHSTAVAALSASDDGDEALIVTIDGGVARVSIDRASTLADKAAAHELAFPRHLWHGLNGRVPLSAFGDVATARARPDDNHGLWSAWRLAALALRFNVTADANAASELRACLEALRRLNAITGIPGLPARSLASPSDPLTPTSWGWNPSPHPGLEGWRFIGNTSSDEIVGHMLGYPLALQLAAAALEPEETSTLAWLSLNITLGIIRHGYKLLDVDGAPTKWGRYDPAALNNDPSWADERGLNSLQIVAHVLAAHRLSEWLGRLDLSAELADAFEHLLLHGYHLNLLNQKIDSPSEINFSDDELSYAPYLSLHFSCVEAPPAATAALCRRVADPSDSPSSAHGRP
jgi:hypothetical protein